jgi:hypothetical protein
MSATAVDNDIRVEIFGLHDRRGRRAPARRGNARRGHPRAADGGLRQSRAAARAPARERERRRAGAAAAARRRGPRTRGPEYPAAARRAPSRSRPSAAWASPGGKWPPVPTDTPAAVNCTSVVYRRIGWRRCVLRFVADGKRIDYKRSFEGLHGAAMIEGRVRIPAVRISSFTRPALLPENKREDLWRFSRTGWASAASRPGEYLAFLERTGRRQECAV